MQLGIYTSGSPMNPVVNLSFDRRGMVVDFSGSHKWSAEELEEVIKVLRSQTWVRKVVEHEEGSELQ